MTKPTYKDKLEKLKSMMVEPPAKCRPPHPKCKGYVAYSMDGNEYDCEYGSKLECDQCKYGGWGGKKDPEAKCNEL